MFTCPSCGSPLKQQKGSLGLFWSCVSCRGRSSTIGQLRRLMPAEAVNGLWRHAREGEAPRKRGCAFCSRPMTEAPVVGAGRGVTLDVCTACQFVWFDPGEFAQMPAAPGEKTAPALPAQAREELALLQLGHIREKAENRDLAGPTPNGWQEWIPAVLGLPVESGAPARARIPMVTWTVALLMALVSVAGFWEPWRLVERYGLVPADYARHDYLTWLTSFFLHGGVWHLLSNLYFLLILGDNVEDVLGRWRYAGLLALAALAGSLAHILGEPRSTLPCIGASGGISGILVFYILKFPQAKLGLMLGWLTRFRLVRMPAYTFFLIWLALQAYGAHEQLAGFGQVSALAHLGGVAAGALAWLATRRTGEEVRNDLEK